MTALVMFFVVLGVCYLSYLIVKFIVWLDGIDEPGAEENVTQEKSTLTPVHTAQRRHAA